MKNVTLLKSLKLYQDNKQKSNEAQLAIAKHLCLLDETDIWRNPEYYKGSDVDSAIFINGTFNNFIKECFGMSSVKYANILSILRLKNGEELYKKHSHEDMVTYLRSNRRERRIILEEWEKRTIKPTFWSIKYQLFIKPNNIESEESNITVLTVREIKELQEENERLNLLIVKKDEEIDTLKKTIAILSGHSDVEQKVASK